VYPSIFTYLTPAKLLRFCCILNAVSINLTWILTILGVIVGGASIPIGLVLTWSRMSTIATIAAPWIGLTFGLIAWLVVTSLRSGSITVATTGIPINAVAGNIASTMTGVIFSLALSFILPWKFTSLDPVAIDRANKIKGIGGNTLGSSHTTEMQASTDVENVPVATTAIDSEKTDVDPITLVASTGNELVDYLSSSHIEPMDPAAVRAATRVAIVCNVIFILIAALLVPYTLFGSSWIFSRAGFKGWCIVSFIWVWVSMVICVIWPLVESWRTISRIFKGLFGSLVKSKV
jgi:hypothetical protein